MLRIITIPNKILKAETALVTPEIIASADFGMFTKDLSPTMRAARGVGLAAPQVNAGISVCVISKDAAPNSLTEDLVLVNPVWTKLSKKEVIDAEGCLSIPNVYGDVSRYKKIHVDALDMLGKPLSFDAQDFFARVIQHEVDHLHGVLFVEKATNMYRVLSEDESEPVQLRDLSII